MDIYGHIVDKFVHSPKPKMQTHDAMVGNLDWVYQTLFKAPAGDCAAGDLSR